MQNFERTGDSDNHTVYEISTSFKVYTLQKISKRLNLENDLLMGYETPY